VICFSHFTTSIKYSIQPIYSTSTIIGFDWRHSLALSGSSRCFTTRFFLSSVQRSTTRYSQLGATRAIVEDHSDFHSSYQLLGGFFELTAFPSQVRLTPFSSSLSSSFPLSTSLLFEYVTPRILSRNKQHSRPLERRSRFPTPLFSQFLHSCHEPATVPRQCFN